MRQWFHIMSDCKIKGLRRFNPDETMDFTDAVKTKGGKDVIGFSVSDSPPAKIRPQQVHLLVGFLIVRQRN